MIEFSKIIEEINSDKDSLYLISTPIGNLSDISIRSLVILDKVDFIICEDTRRTKKLLSKFDIKNKRLIIYNDFNGKIKRKNIINNILKMKYRYAFVSDAGTPLISDPGYKLVKECMKENIKITHLPGPTSVISSLILSGLPTNSFIFAGFFEKTLNKKTNQLLKLVNYDVTSIWFESTNRLLKTLNLIYKIFGNRKISILRELTKVNEEIINGTVKDIINIINNKNNLKGEITLVIEGFIKKKTSLTELKKLILQNLSLIQNTKELSNHLSDKTGLPKKFIYNEILKMK